MALIVEDGTGKIDSQAYISVADADTYLALFGTPADWAAASVGDKEIALRDANRYIDLTYNSRWKGRRTSELQALDWPRFDVTDNDNYLILSDIIPADLANANAEFAVLSITEGLAGSSLMPDIAGPGTIKKERKKLDVLEKETEYQGGKSQIKWYRQADALLQQYIRTFDRLQRA